MKKMIIAGVAGAALMATTVMAQVVNVTVIPGYQQGAGGEFNVTPVIGTGYAPAVLVAGGYETFCLSRDTGIGLPGTYFATPNASGVYFPDNKILAAGTAWLYQQFTAGTLAGYRYNQLGDPGRALDAQNLQLAIWYLEGTYANEIPTYPSINPFLVQVVNVFGSIAAAQMPNQPGGFNVGALNLNDLNTGGFVQPVLTLLSQPSTNPPVEPGDTATIGFWHNKNGQALIKCMPNSPALGNWLAGNFPCLFGNLAGKANTVVAAQFTTYFKITGQKTYAQVMGGALAAYVTDSDLAGNAAAKYGFNVSPEGTGAKTYNVGALGEVLGLSNDTSYTVMELLQAADDNCPFSPAVFNALNVIFSGINEDGDI